MRYLATLIFSILWVLSSSAQDFGTHWISYPLPSDSAEVLFRQSYLMEGRPLQASLSIAKTRLSFRTKAKSGKNLHDLLRTYSHRNSCHTSI